MKRNKFSLSHYKLLTCDMGYLIPLTWLDVMPGDSLQMATSMLIRVSPLLAPVMHPVQVKISHWFIPYRLIWEDFESFITGGDDGLDASEPPYLEINADWSVYESNLLDYLGYVPHNYTGSGIRVSTLPLRAYAKVFNEFFRDQDLVAELNCPTASGSDPTVNAVLASVAWEKDYFTTARTAPQKGASIVIPLSDTSPPVMGIGKTDQNYGSDPTVYQADGTTGKFRSNKADIINNNTGDVYIAGTHATTGFPDIYADLSGLGIDIDDFRLSMALQKYQEARNRYGSRYPEYLKYLGVSPDDKSLQRPVYLGGGKQTIQFSEVLNHSDTDTGSMAGHGIAAMRSNRFRHFFNEHGIVMTLMSAKPRSIYSQGLHRSLLKTTKEDYFQRELENVGDQEVLCEEIYVGSADPEATFGYQDRYDEYRSMPSSIAGEFRSTLDHWHMARIFASEPSLNSTFVTAVPTKRVLASQNTDALYCMASHSIQARRPLRRRR